MDSAGVTLLSFRYTETPVTLRPSLLLWILWSLFAWVGVPVAAPGQAWVDRTGPNGPPPRAGHAMCYDPVRGYVLMVGQYPAPGGTGTVAETWSWNGAAWTLRGGAPQANAGSFQPAFFTANAYALAVHAATSEVFLAVDTSTLNTFGPAVVYRWDGSAWTQVASGLTPQPSFGGFAATTLGMACDPGRNQTVLYSDAAFDRVMVYDGTAWSTRAVTSPVSYISPNGPTVGMAYEPSAAKIVLNNGNGVWLWQWNGFGWNQLSPVGSQGIGSGLLSTDTGRNRVVGWVLGGLVSPQTVALAGATVTPLALPAGPSVRYASAMAYDPVRDVHVFFGGGAYIGGSATTLFGDTWELGLGPVASFTPQGTGCAGSRGVPQLAALGGSLPRVGQTFTMRTTNLPLGGPAFQLLGFSDVDYGGAPLPIDLALLGAPGCWLRTSIETAQPLLNVLGNATWSFVVPPLLGATFYAQTAPFDLGANGLALTFSNGGRVVIGL
jgi:hypothetical protein